MKKFSTALNGYDKNEVNKFVEEVTSEYERVLSKLKLSNIEIDSLKNELKRFENIETTLNKTLRIAEESSDQIKKIAKEEAAIIISDAKKNASHIVNDALLKANKIEQDTENLKREFNLYKLKIKQIIEEQTSIINDFENKNEEF